MAKYNNQKAKILFLQQMLCETGGNHAISMTEILDRLLEKGIRAERKSIYDDMEVLRYFGMDIRYKRERPSGYYLEGGTSFGEATPRTAPSEEPSDENKEITEPNAVQSETGQREWLQASEKEKERRMKLSCRESARKAVEAYFGSQAKLKEKEDGSCIVTAPLQEDVWFYGWLTAMGAEVRLQKPGKLVQSYREYLKSLAKEYKA